MASIAPSVLRQASRLAPRSALSAASRRTLPAALAARVANSPSKIPSSTSTRTYVTESKRDNAKVEVESAIRLDKKELDRSGMTISSQNPEGAHVSPMAGELLFSAVHRCRCY